MEKVSHGNSIFRIVLALVFVSFGVIALGNNLNWWNIDDLFLEWWPLIIILIGLVTVFSPGGSWGGGIFLIFLGVLFLLHSHGIYDIEDLFWPALLIMIGIMIWPRKRKEPKIHGERSRHNHNSSENHTFHSNTIDHVFNFNTILNSQRELIREDQLSGGHGTAVLANLEIDLRQSTPSPSIYLEFTAIFGNITLFVPSDWDIIKHGGPVLGKITDKRSNLNETAQTKTVTIEMNAFFGSIVIMN